MRLPATRAGCTAAAALLAAAGAGVAQTQEGPIIVGERTEKLKPFDLTRLDAALEFRWEYRFNERDVENGQDVKETNNTFRETLNLNTRSFIGHPDLIDISAAGQLGLQDVFLNPSPGEDQHDTNFFNTYDVSAQFLPRGPAPLTLYTRRSESLLNREFGGTLDSTTEESGAILLLFKDVAPTRITYFHREQEVDDPLGISGYDIDQDTVDVHTDWTIDPTQRATFDYTFDHIREDRQLGSAREFDQHNALLTHSLSFGDRNANNLRSSFRYFDQDAEVRQRAFRLDETLFLEHNDWLDSRYALSYDRREINSQTTDFVRGSALVRHRLYESLVTTVSGGGSHQSVDGFTSDELFGNLALDYTKRAPYGRFDASAVAGFNRTDNSALGDPLLILDQVRQFPDADPITIVRRNIDPGSIVVTDASGVIVYREGIDYTVRVLPDRVEIFRLVGGDIAPGEAVLVDFVVQPEPANTVDTVSLGGSARYSINEGFLRGLGVYVNYSNVDQSVDAPAFADIVTNDLQILRYGADYRIGNFFFLAEREERDADISPSDTLRLQARYAQRLGLLSRVGVDYTYQESDFTDEDRTTQLHRVTGRWIQSITPELDMRLRLIYRDEQSSFAGDTRGFEQELEVNWRRNQTHVYTAFSNSMLEGEDVDTTSQTIIVGVRRSF